MLKTVLIITIEHSEPIPDLLDLAAGRIYTMNAIEDVTAVIATHESLEMLELTQPKETM